MSSPKPIDQQFSEGYETRGMQPSLRTTITAKRTVQQAEPRLNNRLDRSGIRGEGASVAPRSVRIDYGPTRKQRLRRPIAKRVRPKLKGLAPGRKAFAYSKATAANISILGWGMALWLFQFQLALVNLVALGGAGALDAITENVLGDLIVSGVDWAFAGYVNAASYLLGYEVSFGLLDSIETLAFVSTMLVWFIGVATLLAMGIQYEIARLSPLYGEGATLKICAVIFALFGYFVPIMNLFPWFIFWCLAVWRYPR